MANEIRAKYPSGNNLYFRVRGISGKVANLNSSAFEAWNNANVTWYGTAMTDAGGGMYVGNVPAWVKALNGMFEIQVCLRAGASQAITDREISGGQILYWFSRERTGQMDTGELLTGGL